MSRIDRPRPGLGRRSAPAGLAVLLALLAGPAAAQNIVANPGFETGTLAPWVVKAPATQYDWTLESGPYEGLTAHAGSYYISNGCVGTACVPTTGTGTSAISQTLATVAGNTYNLTFWIQNVVTSSTPSEVVVQWGGTTVLDLADPISQTGQQFLPQNAPAYTQFSVTVTATSSSTVLTFYGRQDPAWLAIDDISVAPFVTGKVIIDNGAGAGTANDGVLNGAETGHSGVTVSLTNCAGTVYSTAVTGAGGAFSLATDSVPAGSTGSACVVETLPAGYVAVSSSAGGTGGTYTPATQTLKFNFGPTVNVNGIVFGEVPASSFSTVGNQQIAAGQSAVFAHTYIAGDHANVSFSASGAATPATPPWTSVLYLDTSCSGTLSGSDTVISAPIAVTAGQKVCILDKVTSPTGAPTGASDIVTVTATETYTPTPTNGAIVHAYTQTDTATVVASDLSLLKQVRVVATCPSTPADTTVFGASNQASPGNYVEYQVTYSNASSAPLVHITIEDSVPAYTIFESALCGTLPAGESSCSVSAPAVGATSGAITWTLTDSTTAPIGIQPGGSGTVRMCVRVAQ
jgi:uncharacterized repeat protein (TIGR01451 family)